MNVTAVVVWQQGGRVQIDVGRDAQGAKQIGFDTGFQAAHRFGKLPTQGQTLFDTHRLRVLARPYGVLKIDAGPKLMNITFRPQAPVDSRRIIELVQKNRAIKLAGNDKLRIDRELPTPAERAHYIRDVLKALGPPVADRAPA